MVLILAVFTVVVMPLVAVLLSYNQIQQLVHRAEGFAAKTVCCAVFLSNRSVDKFLTENELSTLPPFIVGSTVNQEEGYVESYFLTKELSSVFRMPTATAVYLGPHLGCQLHSETFQQSHMKYRSKAIPPPPLPRPESRSSCVEEVLNNEFSAAGLAHNQTRAAVVIHRGKIVGEAYQSLMGITAAMPLLGWSMTKSVHTAILGAAITAGVVSLDDALELPDMSHAKKERLTELNGGVPLTFRSLLHMSDVLEIEENYGIFADIAHMLYGSPDSAAFAVSRTTRDITPPATGKNESSFGWYYSSGVSNTIAKELRARFPSEEMYQQFPQTHLFSRIGATSFAVEMDTSGTFIASSFAYATARDWARLGELFLRQGRWEGEQILPEGFVELVQQPHPRSGGHYGGQFWLNPARVSVAEYNVLPHDHREKVRRMWTTEVLPADAFYMNGYLGQTTMIIPSLDLVIVRLGFTRDTVKGQVITWDPKVFYGGILECVRAEYRQ
eukprot:CAMPEP_0185000928 /NCGR_PEP_ID=MMETSP1098-20130426/69595_1 /TAXON_ID=89044 /ORGANISM="Spumella elongata, Strain CCAP 955/1" /LENGTH=498 /DNA_ID=CAMNT_0027528165 /DNA_START=15 /DNA_END=1511 /DNA_ORIENTATION=+